MQQHVSLRTYWVIFATLMVLLVVTVGVAQIQLGALSVAVALTIAVVKAMLIILYFMHVRYSPRLIWMIVAAAFFWVLIMIAFTFSDYLTRAILPAPGR